MMKDEFFAGRFMVEVRGLYPVWINLSCDDVDIAHIRHDELADLQFVLQRAVACAKQKLGDAGGEV